MSRAMDLFGRVREAALRWPTEPALRCSDVELDYAQLLERAELVASSLASESMTSHQDVVAVVGHRSIETYVGLLGILASGRAYLPLNPEIPARRNAHVARLAGVDTFVVCPEGEAAYGQLAAQLEGPTRYLWLGGENPSAALPGVSLPGSRQRLGVGEVLPVGPDSLAYLLFTSGSTGVPKGVPIRQRNAAFFLDYMRERYSLAPGDRCSQAFELTFDPSLFDMFATWQSGACLCVPKRPELLNPAGWIRRNELTLWYSVPSIALFMQRFGALKPASLPSLRYSLFAGEALPVELARAWSAAAPDSAVDNLYGPTEATVTCLHYRWKGDESSSLIANGTVPVGEPNPGLVARVVDGEGRDVPPGEPGELLILGGQVAGRYWRDEERSRRSFFEDPDCGAGYRTGDLVRRAEGGEGPLLYLGRIDNQVQVLGHRVELGEVEGALRRASGLASVVALGWPVLGPNVAGGVEVFVEGEVGDPEALLESLGSTLPDYMVPRRLHALPNFPLTAHGKIDRVALLKHLEEDPQ